MFPVARLHEQLGLKLQNIRRIRRNLQRARNGIERLRRLLLRFELARLDRESRPLPDHAADALPHSNRTDFRQRGYSLSRCWCRVSRPPSAAPAAASTPSKSSMQQLLQNIQTCWISSLSVFLIPRRIASTEYRFDLLPDAMFRIRGNMPRQKRQLPRTLTAFLRALSGFRVDPRHFKPLRGRRQRRS